MKKHLLSIFCALAISTANCQSTATIELLNVADDKITSIKPCAGCKAAVAIFISIGCPYDQHYQERIKTLVEKFGSSVSFFLVNSNPEPSENEVKMKEALASWALNIPYLSDKNQTAMLALNAKRTPEAVLLKPTGNVLKTVYQGAIDDNPQVHHDTGKDFLRDAIEELISGKPVKVATERVIGCSIRRKG